MHHTGIKDNEKTYKVAIEITGIPGIAKIRLLYTNYYPRVLETLNGSRKPTLASCKILNLILQNVKAPKAAVNNTKSN